jgi:hypothetical protein
VRFGAVRVEGSRKSGVIVVGMSTARGLSQQEAARYLGVSVRWFRDHVHVEPVPYPSRGDRPLLRYMREDLDALLDQWKAERRTA